MLLGRRKLAVVALQRRRSIAVQGVKQRCKAFVAPAVNRVSVVSVGIVHARQRTFRHAPRQPLRCQRLGKVTLAHHIVDIRLLLGAVGVLVHPARTAVIAGLQLCQRIVVVLLQQIVAVCICLVQVSHVFVIGGLRRLLFLPGQLFGPAGGCVLLCLHLGQQRGVMVGGGGGGSGGVCRGLVRVVVRCI